MHVTCRLLQVRRYIYKSYNLIFSISFTCTPIRLCKMGLVIKLTTLVFVLQEIASVEVFSSLSHLKSKATPDVQAKTAHDLITRFIGQRSSEFSVYINPDLGPKDKDTFQITAADTVNITATTGVAAAMGFYYYLKTYCGCQITWGGQQMALPASLPSIPPPGITVTTNDKFRYYQNVCTVSYSFVWYKWPDWERQIDWMAINGINLPLAFTGQEAIFQRVFMNMGFSMEDIQAFLGGPAFLAWARMGNIQGWGGPISQAWMDDQLILQHHILDRMRAFGMIPVLPGFAGHVPSAITRLYPDANVSQLGDWGRFSKTYCCTFLLDFEDPLFKVIGSNLIKEMFYEFGVDHIYNADTFNEMVPKSSSPSYLASAGRAVYEAMSTADPDAVWLMQGWLFQNTQFWKPPQIKALLTSVQLGKMLILDLFAEISPQFSRTESYYGQPFIWCMLHNFGGTMELYGAIENINVGPINGRKYPNSTMVGIGLTPEGIYQNEAVYEYMNENAYRTEPRNSSDWFIDFGRRRYGRTNQYIQNGWELLRTSVYSDYEGHHDNNNAIITKRPVIGQNEDIWYEPELLYKGWDNFIITADEFGNSSLFRYDLVDVTRNSLQIMSIMYYQQLIDAYKKKDAQNFIDAGSRILLLLKDLDTLLTSDSHFLLGRWIKAAQAWSTDSQEKDKYEYNAKAQITTWGPTGEILDYAAKQWSGTVIGYYRPRWQLFISMLNESLQSGLPFNQTQFDTLVLNTVEIPFTNSKQKYPSTPVGDAVFIAKDIHHRYRNETRNTFFTKLKPDTEERHKKMIQKYDHWTLLHMGKYDRLPEI